MVFYEKSRKKEQKNIKEKRPESSGYKKKNKKKKRPESSG